MAKMEKLKERNLRVTGPDENGYINVYFKRRVTKSSIKDFNESGEAICQYDKDGKLVKISIPYVKEKIPVIPRKW